VGTVPGKKGGGAKKKNFSSEGLAKEQKTVNSESLKPSKFWEDVAEAKKTRHERVFPSGQGGEGNGN